MVERRTQRSQQAVFSLCMHAPLHFGEPSKCLRDHQTACKLAARPRRQTEVRAASVSCRRACRISDRAPASARELNASAQGRSSPAVLQLLPLPLSAARRRRRHPPHPSLPHVRSLPPLPTMASPLISGGEAQWVAAGIGCDCRNDGRRREEYRPLAVQLGVLAQATGSARVQLGDTDVIVGLKVSAQGTGGGGRDVRSGRTGCPGRREAGPARPRSPSAARPAEAAPARWQRPPARCHPCALKLLCVYWVRRRRLATPTPNAQTAGGWCAGWSARRSQARPSGWVGASVLWGRGLLLRWPAPATPACPPADAASALWATRTQPAGPTAPRRGAAATSCLASWPGRWSAASTRGPQVGVNHSWFNVLPCLPLSRGWPFRRQPGQL